jgi:NADPH2 dehydrogenase
MSDFKKIAAYADAADFRAHWQQIDPSMGCSDGLTLEVGGEQDASTISPAVNPMAKPIDVAGRRLANRWAIHPMEGWDGTEDGRPTADTLRRWYHFGLSGAAMIWGGEAYAVCPEGRANPNQLHQGSHEDPVASLKELLAELRRGQKDAGLDPTQALVGLQLTHSGRWSRPTTAGPAPRIAYHHPFLDERVGLTSHNPRNDQANGNHTATDPHPALLSDDELAALPALYAQAARNAQAAGFEFVDVKCCHGYLLHEFLSARTRPGKYGGSFKNRTRLFREIVAAVREACPDLAIGVRISLADDIDGGFGVSATAPKDGATMDRFDPEEPFAFLQLLQDLGIELVNQTLGSPYYCPYVQRPAAFPPSDGKPVDRDPLYAVAEHLQLVRQCKAAFPKLKFVGTGYTYLQDYLPYVAEFEVGGGHVDFVGIGRMVLSYPQMPADQLAGRPMQRKQICRTFSDCTTGPRNGMRSGCYPLDPEYRVRPEAKEVRKLRPSAKP